MVTIEDDDIFFFKDSDDSKTSSTSRTLLKPSKEEIEYRKKYFKSIDVTKEYPDKLCCTKCDKPLNDCVLTGKKVPHHPMLRVLFCKKCRDYYEDGEFSMDEEDGSDKYCRWCGNGGNLFLCTKCPYGFCQICVKKHFTEEKAKKIENDENWLCFFCNPKPMWFHRAVCFSAKIESKRMREALKDGKSKKKVPEVGKAKEAPAKKKGKAEKKVKDGSGTKKSKEKIKKDTEESKSKAEKEGSVEREAKATPEKEKKVVEEPAEARPSSRASDAATVIFDENDPDVDLLLNNNDTSYVSPNTNIDSVFNDTTISNTNNNTPPQLNGKVETGAPRKRRQSSDKETDEDEIPTKRKQKTPKVLNGLNKESSESGIENSNDSTVDFAVLSKFAKRDLEDMYKVTRMTTNLCDKVIEKRLDKIKYVKTFNQYKKEYTKINQIAECLMKNLGDIQRVAAHTMEKLQKSFNEENTN